MAIKRKRKVEVTDINYKMAAVAEKGQVLVYDTVNAGFVKLSASLTTTDKAAGVLMIDVVNKDFNALPQNFQKLETGLSGYVELLKQGELATDKRASGQDGVFGPGSGVYLATDGNVRNKPASGFADDHAGLRLGTALEATDADGFVNVYWNIT